MGGSLTQRQLAAALGQLAEAVTVQRVDGTLLFVNQAAVTLLGCASEAELLALDPREIFDRFRVLHPDGRPVDSDDLPGRRVLMGERPEPMLVRWLAGGEAQELHWSVIRASPLFDEDGTLLGVVNVVDDVTEAQEAHLSQRLLEETVRTLSPGVDYHRTLRQLARGLVPALCDWCGIALAGERGGHELVAWAPTPRGPDSALEEGIAAMLDSGETELIHRMADNALRSVLIVPLLVGDRTIGALALILETPGRHFTPGDVHLAQELGRRTGAAIDQARNYTRRAELSDVIQASLLPPGLPEIPGWSTATYFRAAGEINEVGGDFYDAAPMRDGFVVLVGDVLGKGMSAAALTPRVRHTITTAAQLTGNPVDGLALLDETLAADPERLCCSVAIALLGDAGRLELIRAGHPPPVLVSASGVRPVEDAAGRLLGVVGPRTWPRADVRLTPGEALVLYTDGVTDAVGAGGKRFGLERLTDALTGAFPGGAATIVDRVREALQAFEVGDPRDDVAVLVVQCANA